MYEGRADIREMEHVPGRSINLAMSVRALAALEKLGLDQHIKAIKHKNIIQGGGGGYIYSAFQETALLFS